jgi:hypothetical protein
MSIKMIVRDADFESVRNARFWDIGFIYKRKRKAVSFNAHGFSFLRLFISSGV